MNQENLKIKLLEIIKRGLSIRAISGHTGITYDILAKFKQGKLYLTPTDADKLDVYLDRVVIPTD